MTPNESLPTKQTVVFLNFFNLSVILMLKNAYQVQLNFASLNIALQFLWKREI